MYMKNKTRTNLKTVLTLVIFKNLFKFCSAFSFIFIKGFTLLKVPYDLCLFK